MWQGPESEIIDLNYEFMLNSIWFSSNENEAKTTAVDYSTAVAKTNEMISDSELKKNDVCRTFSRPNIKKHQSELNKHLTNLFEL